MGEVDNFSIGIVAIQKLLMQNLSVGWIIGIELYNAEFGYVYLRKYYEKQTFLNMRLFSLKPTVERTRKKLFVTRVQVGKIK